LKVGGTEMTLNGHPVHLWFTTVTDSISPALRWAAPSVAALSLLVPVQASAAADPVEMLTITASPLSGGNLATDAVSTATQQLDHSDLERSGSASALGALSETANGVSLSNAQGNAFQPNVVYRGFEGSPLVGDSQGLAVYVNGVRFNQAFGDTVNWDLLPDIAIDRLSIEGSSPVFGLNALGGSISVQTKDGFAYHGAQTEISGGSFGLYREAFQFGAEEDNRAIYIAATKLNESGWRDHSPSALSNLFGDVGFRGKAATLHVNLTGAQTNLTGNGAVPVELLAARRSAVFTYPDRTKNNYALASATAMIGLGGPWSLMANAYLDALRQTTLNGDASEIAPCDSVLGSLCFNDNSIATDTTGAPIPDFLSGGTYGQLNRTTTRTFGYGAAAQLNYEGTLFASADHAIFGTAFDRGRSRFQAVSQLGAINADRGFEGPGIVVDQADGSIAPVRVEANNSYYGFYFSNVFELTQAVSVSASARYNVADIMLQDKIGTALNGAHRFARLNRAIGLSAKIADSATIYAGYSEANRAPTPAELSCADELAPCSLTNFFVGDPALKQVVAHTIEAGLRGTMRTSDINFDWHAGLFRTDSNDDIQFVSSSFLGRAFFQNVGTTRRQGADASIKFQYGQLIGRLGYSYTDATFRTGLILSSPENPLSDANGQINVLPGNRLPGIPQHLLKATVGYAFSPSWSVNLNGQLTSGQFLRGDESNLNPQLPGYLNIGLSTRWNLTDRFELFASIENLFDANYAGFGTFSPTDRIPIREVPGASDPRSVSPSAPRSFYAGMRARL
jgi:iron complex outermembrane recepter protein